MVKIGIGLGGPAVCFILAFVAFNVDSISNWLGVLFIVLGAGLFLGGLWISNQD